MRSICVVEYSKKLGQGATEYLVLLAVVLIVALVSVALLGFFPGMAGDAQRDQSRLYWQSQTPIAIIDGSASSYNTHLDGDQVVLTLKNTAGYPVKLLAITNGGGQNSANIGSSGMDGNIYGIAPLSNYTPGEYYQLLATGFPSASYAAYVASPRGTGVWNTSHAYTSDIILQPGETITVGYISTAKTAHPINYGVSSLCGADGNLLTGKYLTFDNFNIYYQSINNGKELLKKTTGTKPLVLPCTDAALWTTVS